MESGASEKKYQTILIIDLIMSHRCSNLIYMTSTEIIQTINDNYTNRFNIAADAAANNTDEDFAIRAIATRRQNAQETVFALFSAMSGGTCTRAIHDVRIDRRIAASAGFTAADIDFARRANAECVN